MKLLLVCAGGALGSGARYLVGLWAVEKLGSSFPWGTLAVNLLGCLVLGALMRVGEKSSLLSPVAFVALTTGVMGGFTTYSSFNFEVFRMVELGRAGTAATYVLLTLAGGALAGAAGWFAARAAVA